MASRAPTRPPARRSRKSPVQLQVDGDISARSPCSWDWRKDVPQRVPPCLEDPGVRLCVAQVPGGCPGRSLCDCCAPITLHVVTWESWCPSAPCQGPSRGDSDSPLGRWLERWRLPPGSRLEGGASVRAGRVGNLSPQGTRSRLPGWCSPAQAPPRSAPAAPRGSWHPAAPQGQPPGAASNSVRWGRLPGNLKAVRPFTWHRGQVCPSGPFSVTSTPPPPR